MANNRTYWASELNQKRLVGRALERMAWHLAAMRSIGRWDSAMRSMRAYFGHGLDAAQDSNSLRDRGEQGEVTAMHVNRLRPVVQSIHSIVCGVRPALKPVATNADAASAAETRFAVGLNEFYQHKLRASTLEESAMRLALLAGSCAYVQRWAPSAGAEIAYDIDEDRVVYEGDIEEFLVPPWRIAFEEPVAPHPRWCLFRARESRFDLAARVKDETNRDKLLSASVRAEAETYGQRISALEIRTLDRHTQLLMGEDIRVEDEVWVWELRHLPTPALPLGRLVRFCEPDIILFDSLFAGEPPPDVEGMEVPQQQATAYPYEELHAYEVCPERNPASGKGHSLVFDLGALQEFHDVCTASIATTVNLMGMPHLWSPTGSAPQVHQLSTGPTVLESAQAPQVVSFAALKPEVVEAAQWAASTMNAVAALNDVVMGNPQKGMPASAQALQRAQAVSFHAPTQGDWIRLIGQVANGRLRILKRFAKTERVAEIAGGGDTWELRQWSRADIANVPRFQVEPINPMSATFEGRQAIAEQMGVQGDALFDFVTTGSLRKVTEQRTLQLELVERNKALLMRGVGLAPVDMAASMAKGAPVFVEDGAEHVSILRSDPHHLAIPAYLSTLNSPEARADARQATAALDAVSESLRLWLTLTQDECVAFGIPPLPSTLAANALGSAAAPVAPDPAPAQPQTGEARKPMVGAQPEAASELPSPPENPLTGEKQSADALAVGDNAAQ